VSNEPAFLSGVIEGFYGPPWSHAERVVLFQWMQDWGLNTYMYAPKDDLKHRAQWRELYSETESSELQAIIRATDQHQIGFFYALSPGLDITYSATADQDQLKQKLAQVMALGARNFCLLFDDIPDQMHPADVRCWDSLAAAQAAVTNDLYRWVREHQPAARFLFCPTPYCGRMARSEHGGKDYLSILGRELHQEIDVFWTGQEIISREITVPQTRDLAQLMQRKPLLWENLHANDYDGRRFFCGPYSGRPREILQELGGVLCNPNCEFPLNFVPWRTLARFVHEQGAWEPHQAYLEALREWLPHFATVGAPITFDDLVLFGDSFYLPYEEGPEAETLFALTQELLTVDPASRPEALAQFRERTARLKACCARMAELRHRPLFHALYRRTWELREELDLLQRCVEQRTLPGRLNEPCRSDFHLPHTYRGGLVARLQKLLVQEADGSFTVAPVTIQK